MHQWHLPRDAFLHCLFVFNVEHNAFLFSCAPGSLNCIWRFGALVVGACVLDLAATGRLVGFEVVSLKGTVAVGARLGAGVGCAVSWTGAPVVDGGPDVQVVFWHIPMVP